MRSVFLLLSFLIGVQTFYFLRKNNSKNHQEITRYAILHATARVCERVVTSFKKPDQLNVESLATACKKQRYVNHFEKGIRVVSYYNVMTDVNYYGPEYHFDNEMFEEGKALIINGTNTIINQMQNGSFDDARKTLGQIMHILQDFYSHSNWVELENNEPCTALIKPHEEIPNPADKDTATCEDTPNGRSLAFKREVAERKILTSGYTRKSKPNGKCSHGGFRDFPCGINKDFSASCHGSWHNKAADVAISASVQLLEEIKRRSDDLSFFKLVGLHEASLKGKWIALLFSAFRNRYPDASERPETVVEEQMD